jgi:hypothetical protein
MKAMKSGTAAVALAAVAAFLGGCQDRSTAAAPTWVTPVAVSATAASATADNGVAKLSAAQILAHAGTALKGAKSFRIAGSGSDDGEQMTLDIKISGKNEIGSVTVGKEKIGLLRVGTDAYISGNQAFWQASAGTKGKADAQLVGDRWMSVPATDKNYAGLFDIVDVDDMFKPDSKITKGAPKTFGGHPAITLVDSSSDGFGHLYIATTGRPYPLGTDGAGAGGTMKFSDFGATFADLKKPASTDVVDLAALAK